MHSMLGALPAKVAHGKNMEQATSHGNLPQPFISESPVPANSKALISAPKTLNELASGFCLAPLPIRTLRHQILSPTLQHIGMKFEDFLMERYSKHQKRLDLDQEVAELQTVLEKEYRLNQILRCALQWPPVCGSCLSSLLPPQVQVLLAELAMVEEEIIYLEKKVEDLKLCIYQERKQKKEWNVQQQQQQWQRQQRHFLCGLGGQKGIQEVEQSTRLPDIERSQSPAQERYLPVELVSDVKSMSCTETYDEEAERPRRCSGSNHNLSHLDAEACNESPNQLSEELIKILISIFHKLNQTSTQLNGELTAAPKLNISCMSSRSLVSKPSFNYVDGTARDIGLYKKFTHFTQSSFDMSRISLCFSAIGRLRVMMHKLCNVKLSSLTYKQKLAFWINIYNACIMHAFLQHGLPPSPDKLLALLNKAAANVGGIVLNALAIEHFILRHSPDTKSGVMDEKEAFLRHAYGLGYPEPNITFALCRGTMSSPALRVYTAENVVNELERAKVEYLEASVSITNKKKIILPRLLHWHMRDFADDVESLLEWIYSQLPRSRPLKRMIKECLNGDTKIPLKKIVEIEPYEAEFRYLLPF